MFPPIPPSQSLLNFVPPDTIHKTNYSSSLPTNSAGELNILGHYYDAIAADCTQVRVFKESNKVGFGGFL